MANDFKRETLVRLAIGCIPIIVVVVLLGSVALTVPSLRGPRGASAVPPTLPVPIVLVHDKTAGVESKILPADSTFAFDSSDLNDDARQQLTKFAAELKGSGVVQVVVLGHTDRLGSIEINDKVSQDRANVVRTALVNGGIEAAIVTAVGVGKRAPLTRANECPGLTADLQTKICLARDRRVEIWTRIPPHSRPTSAPR